MVAFLERAIHTKIGFIEYVSPKIVEFIEKHSIGLSIIHVVSQNFWEGFDILQGFFFPSN